MLDFDLTIPGVEVVSDAVILFEYGDILKFKLLLKYITHKT